MGLFDIFKGEGKVDKKFKTLHKSLELSFSNIRRDAENFTKWISHLEEHRGHHHSKLEDIEKRLYFLEKLLEDMKYKQQFVQTPNLNNKQTVVRLKQTSVGVQTPVQTGVQTPVDIGKTELENILRSLTVMERAVLWTLLNTDIKMSYDDLAMLLGKDKSTLRGQISNIKRKSESLISELTEINGKKKFFVDETIKKVVIGRIKERVVSIKSSEKRTKNKKNET